MAVGIASTALSIQKCSFHNLFPNDLKGMKLVNDVLIDRFSELHWLMAIDFCKQHLHTMRAAPPKSYKSGLGMAGLAVLASIPSSRVHI